MQRVAMGKDKAELIANLSNGRAFAAVKALEVNQPKRKERPKKRLISLVARSA